MKSPLGTLVRCLDERRAEAAPNDRDLLCRYANDRDEDAFGLLVGRHGPLVWGVCRRALPDADAEDVYQATFLVLARKAGSLAWQASIGPWLHAVATRLARKARSGRRSIPLAEAIDPQGDPLDTLAAREMLVALDEELAALPEPQAAPVLLCLVEGQTQAEVAHLLGISLSTLRRRLEHGRQRLERRLRRRGLASAPLTLSTLAVGTAPALLPAVALSARVIALAEAFAPAWVGLRAILCGLVLLGCVGVGFALATAQPKPPAPPEPAAPRVEATRPPPAVDARTDRHGDPLPSEALARLGTVRLRLGMKPTDLVFAPDGNLVVSITHDYGVRLWEVPTGKELDALPGLPNTYTKAAFSGDGKRLAVIANNLGVVVYAVNARPAGLGRELFRARPKDGPLDFVAFLRDGSVLTATNSERFTVYDADGKQASEFGTRVAPEQRQFALSPDEKYLALGTEKGGLTLWDVARGEVAFTLPGLLPIRSLAFSPDGKILATGDDQNTIHTWNLAERKVERRLVGVKAPGQTRGVGDAIHSVAFSPDGKTLYSLGDYGDGTIRVWDVFTGKQTDSMQGRNGDGDRLALTRDGKRLAVVGANSTVHLWDTATGKAIDQALGTQGIVTGVAVAPSGAEIAVAGNDGTVYVWDPTGKPLRQWRAHERQIGRLVYAPENGRLYSCGAYEPARSWDAAGKRVREYAGSAGSVRGVNFLAVSPEGNELAVAANDRMVQLLDAATGKLEKTLAEGSIDRLAFSPDGKTLAAGGFDKQVHLWDVVTGKELWQAPLGSSIADLAFAPDGEAVAVGLYSGRVVLLASKTGTVVTDLHDRNRTVRAVAFSPDGRLLAASGDGLDVSVYELATKLRVRKLEGHQAPVWTLAFTPDSRALVSGSNDGTALVWDVSGRVLAAKRRKPPTEDELEAAWTLLGQAESVEGYDAVLMLASAPTETAAFLRAKWIASPPPTQKTIARLLTDLDAEEFEVRDRASTVLAGLGKRVEKELRGELAETKSPEVRRRLEDLLALLRKSGNETVRAHRAVAALELAGARMLLEHLARKGATEDLRRLAERAVARLPR